MSETYLSKQIISARGVIDNEGTPRGILMGTDDSVVTQIVDLNGNKLTTKPNTHNSTPEVLVNLEGHVCTDNSSATPLGISETFPGSWQDTIDYGTIIIGVKADQDSATDGLVIEWSADGITAHDDDVFSILAGHGKVFTFAPARRYFRVKYTNGLVAQGTFNLQSILRRYYVKPSSHRVSDSIVAEDDAELMKSVITGERQDGIFKTVGLDNGDNLRVNAFPYTYSIAEGDLPDHKALLKFGTRTSVAAGVNSTIWEGTTALYPYMTTAQQLKIVSTDAQDGVGGTGIRTLFLQGLDANFNEISETITMNGLGVVTSSLSYLRVFRAYGLTCGTTGTNVGTIYVRNNAATVVQLRINPGDGQTLMTIWTVPAGYKAFIVNGSFSSNSNKGATVSFFTRTNITGVAQPWLIKYRAYTFSGNENFVFTIPFPIIEKTDIEVRILTPGSAGTTSAGATFELWYELA
jgi:hypothetical protein